MRRLVYNRTNSAEAPAPSWLSGLVGWMEARSVLRPGDAARLWMLAAILTVAAHALWATWLETIPAYGRRLAPTPPHYSLMPPSGKPDATTAFDASVWSPSWFARPSARGFSRPALQEGFKFRPPLARPFRSEVTLARPDAPPAPVIPAQSLLKVMGLHEIPSVAPPRTAFAHAGRRPPRMIQLNLDLPLKSSPPVELNWADELTASNQGPWQAEAALHVEPAGWVSGVFLTSATVSNSTRYALLRSLYGWKFSPAAAPRDGTVSLRYPGADFPPVNESREK